MAIVQTDETVTGQGRSSFDGRLKDDYVPTWDDHVHVGTKIAEKIAKKKGTMGGRQSIASVATSLPQSAGVALLEGMDLPTPRAGTYANPYMHARDIYTRLRWSGQVERAARMGDKHAWTKPRIEDIKNATSQFNINFARMLYLGRYQPLATVASFNGTTTATLHGRDARTSASTDFWKFGAHYLRVGMAIDFLDGGLSTTAAEYQNATAPAPAIITAMDVSTPSAPTVTLSIDPATLSIDDPASGDILIPYQSRNKGVSSVNNSSEFSGVSGLLEYCSDADTYAAVYDLARSSYPTLSGVHNENGGTVRAFDENLIALVVDQVVDSGVGKDPTDLVMHSSVRREYVKQTQGDRRFAPVQKDKGYSGRLVFSAGDAELPILVDKDCPPGLAFVLNADVWGWLSQSEMGPLNGQSERFVADKDANEVIMHKSGNVFCEQPFGQGIIDDILFDTDAVTAS